ncbi:hypothetical protein HUU42_05005 [bacterium]|nr:hypothetical protein [bacterium]
MVDSNDIRMEQMIIGSWVLQNNTDPNSTINLTFNSDFSVHIVNTSPDNPRNENYLFRIEDNVLFFFDEDEEYAFNIIEINSLQLVLRFFSDQQTVTQTYTRAS